MTDRITKSLAKLSKRELQSVESILQKIEAGDFSGLNVLQLKGYSDVYRVRKGRIRIIFQQTQTSVIVLDIGRRNEKTSKGF